MLESHIFTPTQGNPRKCDACGHHKYHFVHGGAVSAQEVTINGLTGTDINKIRQHLSIMLTSRQIDNHMTGYHVIKNTMRKLNIGE